MRSVLRNWRNRERLAAVLRPWFRLGLRSAAGLTGKLRPLAGGGHEALLARSRPDEVPPPELWEGYADSAEDYLAGGIADMDGVMALLSRHGIERPRVALDLGCAAGRMVRHFPRDESSEIWGLDISAPYIAWCQRNLPGINFATISTAPHLPFADGYFDFVFCASVFTHMTDLADAWLLEIRRVLKPGGHLYLTLHDEVSYEQLLTTYAETMPGAFVEQVADFERRNGARDKAWDMLFFGADPTSQVFYRSDYIVRKWSRWLELVTYEPQLHNYQSAMLLRRPSGAS